MNTLTTIIEFVSSSNPNPNPINADISSVASTGDFIGIIFLCLVIVAFLSFAYWTFINNKRNKTFTSNKQHVISLNNKIAIISLIVAPIALIGLISFSATKALADEQNSNNAAPATVKAFVDDQTGNVTIEDGYLYKNDVSKSTLKSINIEKCDGIEGIDDATWTVNVSNKATFTGKPGQTQDFDIEVKNETVQYSVKDLNAETAMQLIGKQVVKVNYSLEDVASLITGQITDKDGNPIPGVFVDLYSTNDPESIAQRVSTDKDGKYTIKHNKNEMVFLRFSKADYYGKDSDPFYADNYVSRSVTVLAPSQLTVSNLKTDGEVCPTNVDNEHPVFSWVPGSLASDQKQRKFAIHATNASTGSTVWTYSEESENTSVAYNGESLNPNTTYKWAVSIFDNHSNIATESTYFTTGLQGDWSEAQYISNEEDQNNNSKDNDGEVTSVRTFRTEFSVNKEISHAQLSATALGVYEAYINGQRVGTKLDSGQIQYNELQPGFTEGDKRQYYTGYDVTWMINSGKNALSAIVTSGWWNGLAGGSQFRDNPIMALKAKLEITYSDGSTQIIVTNPDTWKSSTEASPVKAAAIFYGEDYDARALTNWQKADFDDKNWQNVYINEQFDGELDAWMGSQIRIRQDLERQAVNGEINRFDPKDIEGATEAQYGKIKVIQSYNKDDVIDLPKGQKLVINFGQNAAGWEQFSVSAIAGTIVTVNHGEMLCDSMGEKSRNNTGPAGTMFTSNRGARATTNYTVGQSNVWETYHPTMTYYGFQYIEISASENITIKNIKALTVSSAEKDTGRINTYNADIDRLVQNSRWSMYSNYFAVPTDCPQRDERQGWTGDTQVYCETGSFLNYSKTFLEKFCVDIADGQCDHETGMPQHSPGAYPSTSPTGYYHGGGGGGSEETNWGATGWSDCGIILPYTIMEMYGDASIAQRNWDSMEKYMKYINDKWGKEGPYGCWGDWLALDGNDDRVKPCLNISYYAMDARMMAKMAAALGKQDKVNYYNGIYEQEKEYFQEKYIENGQLKNSNMQTVCLYALYLDFLPEDMIEPVTEQLLTNFKNAGDKLQTGFMGTKIILDTLTKVGRSDYAYTLLLQDGYPSWLYPVKNGATTVWERWDAYIKETGFQGTGMNSYNHYAYGSVVAWMFHTMLGINSDQTDESSYGFKHINIAPYPNKNFPHVDGGYESAIGPINVDSYYNENQNWKYNVEIPSNTTASIKIPKMNFGKCSVNGKDCEKLTLTEDGIELDKSKTTEGELVFNSNNGSFQFLLEVIYPNAVLVDNAQASYKKGDLVFFFDEKDHSNLGTQYKIFNGQESPIPWASRMSDIKNVYFDESFQNCEHLLSLNNFFENAENLESFDGSNLKHADKIKSTDRCFLNCPKLSDKKVIWPENLTIAGQFMFYNDTNIEQLPFGNTIVRNISGGAFGFTNFEKNQLHEDKNHLMVDKSGKYVFRATENFNAEKITLDSYYCIAAGGFFIPTRTNDSLKTVIVPKSNATIGISDYAFENCYNLQRYIVEAEGIDDQVTYNGSPFNHSCVGENVVPLAVVGGSATQSVDTSCGINKEKTADKYIYTPVTTFDDTDFLNTGHYYILQNDIKTHKRLIVGNTEYSNIALDLNGHTLDRGQTEPIRYGYVMVFHNEYQVNMRLDDSSTFDASKSGKITGGYTDSYSAIENVENTGGAINLSPAKHSNRPSKLTMINGQLTGNKAMYGGAVALDGHENDHHNSPRCFDMYGGIIANNSVYENERGEGAKGAGVYVGEEGVFNLYGGEIINNTIDKKYTNGKGAGVYLSNASQFTMRGGKVLNNKLHDTIGGITNNPRATLKFIGVKETDDYILE